MRKAWMYAWCFFALSCAAQSHQKPREAVMHLLTLYGKNRFEFVRTLSSYENSSDCTYVTSLRREAEYLERDGTIGKDLEHDILIVKLELQQAENVCKR